MKLGELYNQNEAKKRRIVNFIVDIVPKRAKELLRQLLCHGFARINPAQAYGLLTQVDP